MRRLYIFAGKGGVGKTALSLAFTKHLLNHHGKNVLYTFFDQNYASYLCDNLKIPKLQMNVEDSLGAYVEKKIGSKIIANTILKTPFFKSLFHMLPGLGYVGMLGSLVDRLNRDNSLVSVLDPPATGHFLTMLSSLHNFKEIFGTGIFADDIEKIKLFIRLNESCKITVVSLPTEMALQEAVDLRVEIGNYFHDNVDIVVNDSFKFSDNLRNEALPEFLYQKIQMEEKVLQEVNVRMGLPHVFSNSFEEVVKDLSLRMESFV